MRDDLPRPGAEGQGPSDRGVSAIPGAAAGPRGKPGARLRAGQRAGGGADDGEGQGAAEIFWRRRLVT